MTETPTLALRSIRASLDAGYFVETTKDPHDDDAHLVGLFSIKGRRGGGPTLAMRLDFEDGAYWKVDSPQKKKNVSRCKF